MNPARLRRWLLIGLLGVSVDAPLATTLHGTIIGVVGGDTGVVADGRHRKTKLRLAGIDAPEKISLMAAKPAPIWRNWCWARR